jgi:hypothetical protein
MSKQLEIKETNQNINYWLSNPLIDDEQKRKVLKAKIVVIPLPPILNSDKMMYMRGTIHMLDYVQSRLDNPSDISFLIEKGTSQAIACSTLVILGVFVVQSIITPIFINLLYDYFKSKVKQSKDDLVFRLTLNIEKKNDIESRTFKIDFEGSVDDFKEVIDKVKELTDSSKIVDLPINRD